MNAVKVKPLDLSNTLKHAFIAGRISAGASNSSHGHAWVAYDPTESPAYARILSAIEPQPDLRPLSEAEAFALSAPTNAPHASNADMQEWLLEWAESIQQPDPRDEVIAALVEALLAMHRAVCGEKGFAECVRAHSKTAYPWPALDEAGELARAALAAAKAVQP